MKNSTRLVANLAKWSRGMIRALGARGPGFESPFGPLILLTAKTANYINSLFFRMYTGLQCEGWITIYFWIPHSCLILSWNISFFSPYTSEKLPFEDVRLVGWWVKSVRANPDYENFCQKWDSNPRPQKWTATWTQRLRPLGHPDFLLRQNVYYKYRKHKRYYILPSFQLGSVEI